jgi:hypothetical protein
MTEEGAKYRIGPTDGAEPPLATEDLVAQAHAHRQGIPYETGEQWLQRLPEQLRDLADLVLSGKARTGDVAYAVAALIDRIENTLGDEDCRRH